MSGDSRLLTQYARKIEEIAAKNPSPISRLSSNFKPLDICSCHITKMGMMACAKSDEAAHPAVTKL